MKSRHRNRNQYKIYNDKHAELFQRQMKIWEIQYVKKKKNPIYPSMLHSKAAYSPKHSWLIAHILRLHITYFLLIGISYPSGVSQLLSLSKKYKYPISLGGLTEAPTLASLKITHLPSLRM
jgi:hypothetical protein